MIERLLIVRRKFFKEYKSKQPITISKHIKRLEQILRTPQTFKFYLIASSCNSSMIEGSNIDTDTYYQLKETGLASKGIREIEDIVKTYEYASSNILNQTNFLTAHKTISSNLNIAKKYHGRYRDKAVSVWGNGKIIYTGAAPSIVLREMNKLFHDIDLLIKRELSIDEIFYFAAMIQLIFVSIHPFADGNGRMGRLLEKWFLASKLGKIAWCIQSEKLYYKRKISYYTRLRNAGANYKTIDYSKGIDFLTLLPMALNIK